MRLAAAVLFLNASVVGANELCAAVSGARIIAQDDENTYLGKVASAYDSDSIFNEYDSYGSEYSSDSIWNEYSEWGDEYSSVSPFNKYSSTPPMLIKDGEVIGYLSANKSMKAAVSPSMLKALCEDEL
ncbi:MAG: hypothetical protein VYB93_07750 [Pseudomonadota bacterium]|jgi:hypothetical protein|nr:hypothetical protein [Pseudomonadota bacterium]